MELEVFTDFACPWCYIGAHRLEAALAAFARAERVRVRWRSYLLAPAAQPAGGDELARVARVAHADGLEMDAGAVLRADTFDAHRLVHLAGPATERGTRMVHALYRAHFVDGALVDDPDILAALAEGEGLDAAVVRAELARTDATDTGVAVREDEELSRRLGVNGVPFFVADRTYAISGAQPVDVLTRMLTIAFDGLGHSTDWRAHE